MLQPADTDLTEAEQKLLDATTVFNAALIEARNAGVVLTASVSNPSLLNNMATVGLRFYRWTADAISYVCVYDTRGPSHR